MLSCRETRDESCEAAYLNGSGAKCRILSSPRFSLQNTLGYVVRKGFKRTCGAANHCAQPNMLITQVEFYERQALQPWRKSEKLAVESARTTLPAFPNVCRKRVRKRTSPKREKGQKQNMPQGSKPTTLSHRLPLRQITLFQMQTCDYRRKSYTKKRCCKSPGAVRWPIFPRPEPRVARTTTC